MIRSSRATHVVSGEQGQRNLPSGRRWGELAALRRCDLDPELGTVSVRRQQVELDTGQLIVTPPKSAADVRTVVIPPAVLGAVRDYLEAGKDQPTRCAPV
jgi:integrase